MKNFRLARGDVDLKVEFAKNSVFRDACSHAKFIFAVLFVFFFFFYYFIFSFFPFPFTFSFFFIFHYKNEKSRPSQGCWFVAEATKLSPPRGKINSASGKLTNFSHARKFVALRLFWPFLVIFGDFRHFCRYKLAVCPFSVKTGCKGRKWPKKGLNGPKMADFRNRLAYGDLWDRKNRESLLSWKSRKVATSLGFFRVKNPETWSILVIFGGKNDQNGWVIRSAVLDLSPLLVFRGASLFCTYHFDFSKSQLDLLFRFSILAFPV